MLWDLFVTFLMIGTVSFGGGYSMIPVIEREVVRDHGWMSLQTFTDVVAVAGMSPGPIATNSAIFIGYKTAGVPGALVSALGTVLPSLALIVAAAAIFYKVQKNVHVKRGFYGLRPIITGLIFYAAISFAVGNQVIPTTAASFNRHTIILVLICAASLFALIRFRMHPAAVIMLSGLAGMVLFG
ncbi:chromate transporter [Paenibacillus alkalitolerans]|uniref:chromate transporter n=1 Tax=Paenibacillus alkalitolerans TaxID=2799335 RepID=UPI0018F5A0E0|nr:chromate transporter [Paenibacillus alkalitolerans]